jgi:hypothetical protein
MKYVSTFFNFLGIWFAASFINGLLSGLCIILLEPQTAYYSFGTILFSIFFSFFFSMPLVGGVWVITTVVQLYGSKENVFFQIVLGVTLIASIIGALFFINGLGNEFMGAKYAVGVCIIVSALTAVLTFRKQLKSLH